MKALFWRAVTRIVCMPWVTDFLIKVSMRNPHLHIGDYMKRYWLIPYTWEWPVAIRINNILRPDADPYLHDHPWPWRTIVLRGWYLEEDVFGRFQLRQAGYTGGNSAETMHRIDEVSRGGVWTLFFSFRKSNDWGFMVGNPARKIYYRDYESTNNRDGETRESSTPQSNTHTLSEKETA